MPRTELALLVDDRTSHHRASAGEACDYAAQLQADIAHEREAIERRELSKRANITARFGRQIEEKRAERIAQRREVSDASPSPLVQPHHTINIAGASHSPWYRRQDSESAALYPDLRVGKTRRPVDESRRRVFADLNSHGYYQGAALRFGGDYLAYPGALAGLARKVGSLGTPR